MMTEYLHNLVKSSLSSYINDSWYSFLARSSRRRLETNVTRPTRTADAVSEGADVQPGLAVQFGVGPGTSPALRVVPSVSQDHHTLGRPAATTLSLLFVASRPPVRQLDVRSH